MCFCISENFGVERIHFDKIITQLKSQGNTIIRFEITEKNTNIQNCNYKKIVHFLGSNIN